MKTTLKEQFELMSNDFKSRVCKSFEKHGLHIAPETIVEWTEEQFLGATTFEYEIEMPYTPEDHAELLNELLSLPRANYLTNLWVSNNLIHILIQDNSQEFKSWL